MRQRAVTNPWHVRVRCAPALHSQGWAHFADAEDFLLRAMRDNDQAWGEVVLHYAPGVTPIIVQRFKRKDAPYSSLLSANFRSHKP